MYLRLAIRNIANRKTRAILTTIGITIGIASLILMVALSKGLEKAAVQNITGGGSITKLTVQPKVEKVAKALNLLPLGQQKITPEIFAQVQNIQHVTSVYPEMIYGNFSSMQISWMGENLQTDMMIFGVPYEFIAGDYKGSKESWDNAAPPYPALISNKIIDIYNFTIAPTSGLPFFTQNDLSGIDVTLLPDESTFFPQTGKTQEQVGAKLVGFSNQTSIVGVTIPIEAVRKLNRQHNPNYTDSFLRLHVQVDSADNVENVREKIMALGFDATSPVEEINTIAENFRTIQLGLGSISLIILFVAGLMIANTFFSAVMERKHEIGIYRALGATRRHIKQIFLLEATIIGLAGGIGGIVIGIIAGLFLNKSILDALANISIKPGTLFVFDPLVSLFAILFSVILSIIFSYIPATFAARLDPLEAFQD